MWLVLVGRAPVFPGLRDAGAAHWACWRCWTRGVPDEKVSGGGQRTTHGYAGTWWNYSEIYPHMLKENDAFLRDL